MLSHKPYSTSYHGDEEVSGCKHELETFWMKHMYSAFYLSSLFFGRIINQLIWFNKIQISRLWQRVNSNSEACICYHRPISPIWLLPRKKELSTLLSRNRERVDTICYLFLSPFFNSLNASPPFLYFPQLAALSTRSHDILSYLVQEAPISTKSQLCPSRGTGGPSKSRGTLCS